MNENILKTECYKNKGLLSPLQAATGETSKPSSQIRRWIHDGAESAVAILKGDRMSSPMKLKDLARDNIDKGATSVEQVHRAIAAVPSEVLVEIGALESAAKSTLTIHEETNMKMDGQTLRGNEMVIPHVDLESVKERTKATFARESLVEVALLACTLTGIGLVLFSLQRAMESYVVLGF